MDLSGYIDSGPRHNYIYHQHSNDDCYRPRNLGDRPDPPLDETLDLAMRSLAYAGRI